MIVITRALARRFRAVARKCVNGRPRAPASAVIIQARDGLLMLWAKLDEAELVYSAPADAGAGNGTIVVPMAVLESAEGNTPDTVELSVRRDLTGTATWVQDGGSRSLPFDAVLTGKQHMPPAPPADPAPVPVTFLTALHECGRTAARGGSRLALHRVQVQGKAGRVVGTDGRAALLWGGFDLPFPNAILVPALPVFGCKELAGETEILAGATSSHLVVAAGPWMVRLPIDRVSRYPDVAGAVPKPLPGSVAGIDDKDAEDLLAALPGLPGRDDEDRPVTVELNGSVRIVAKDPQSGAAEAVAMPNTTSAGPNVRLTVDRRYLSRALALGCRTFRLAAGKPVVAEAGDRTFIFMALDDAPTAPAGGMDLGTAAGDSDRSPPPKTTDRRAVMKPNETNGVGSNGRHDPPDPLAEAEGLRNALADAAHRAGRLVAVLKHVRKERRALASVWAGLKQLRLGPPGGSP